MITNFKLFESRLTIPRIKINGIYYHGSSIRDDSDLIYGFRIGYSDWDTTWVSSDENISEEFSYESCGSEDIKVIYRVKVKSNAIADIDYQTSQKIIKNWELYDFRECIDGLKEKGFRGWLTPGSIGSHMYDDIALFYPDEQTEILECKLGLIVDSEDWTEYMSLDKAQKILDEHYRDADWKV
jgi:hypothetical protein